MGSGWWGGQGGCERTIEVFVKIQKKKKLGGGSGKKKQIGGGGPGGGGPGGSGGGWVGGEVKVDVNEELKFL